jgi:hypothetical protein
VNAEKPLFLRVFDELLPERLRSRYNGPSSLLDAWRGVVEDASEGYGFGLDEFKNDLWVRDFIERLTTDPRVLGDPVRDEFRAAVDAVDSRFRALLQPDVHIGPPEAPWWQRGVLRQADEEYADDLRQGYGVEVERT